MTKATSARSRRLENQQKYARIPPVTQSVGMPGYMLGLQRQYGNHLVQRIAELSQQDSGSEEMAQLVTHAHRTRRTMVNRFIGPEHKLVGDLAAGSRWVVVQPGDPTKGLKEYKLLYGDMVALAGDYFENLEQMKDLARTESGQREIEFARFHAGIISQEPEGVTVAEKTNVERRYYELNKTNFHHFTQSTTQDNSLAKYLSGHKKAIDTAFLAQKRGESIDEALAIEAFHAHFLTDAFTAGHITTPRQGLEEHWRDLYPLFLDNLFQHLAEHIATYMNKGFKAILTIAFLKEQVIGKLSAVAPPGVTGYSLGGLLAGALHDLRNKEGLAVVSAAGPTGQKAENGYRWTAFGEKPGRRLGEKGTEAQLDMAVAAVKMGLEDVNLAYDRKKCRTFAQLKNVGKAKPGQYRVELLVPKAEPSRELETEADWRLKSVDDLVKNEKMMRAIKLMVAPDGTVGSVLDSAVTKIPADQPDARKGFRHWIARLRSSTGLVLKEIANYVPGGAKHHFSTDTMSRDYIKQLKQETKLNLLTTEQMVGLIGKMLRGFTGNEDEKAIIDVLRAATQRGTVAQVIESVGFKRLESNFHGAERRTLLTVLRGGYLKNMAPADKVQFINLLFKEYRTGERGEEICIAVLNAASESGDFLQIVTAVGKEKLDKYLDGAEQDRFDELLQLHNYAT